MRFSVSRYVLFPIMLMASVSLASGPSEAEQALRELFRRQAPEDSRQLRQLWERENMLGTILSMDSVHDWAGLRPGVITVTDDCVEGSGGLRIPVHVDVGKHLRIENNFVAGHRDGFRNMMCMGIEVEDFRPYRSVKFAYKPDLAGDHVLMFRIYDRIGGWLDWTIPTTTADKKWVPAVLVVPPHASRLVDMSRIGGVMFELRALSAPVRGTFLLDHIELMEDCVEGIEANTHALPDMSYDEHPAALSIENAYTTKPTEFIFNMSPLELPIWENDHKATMRCLEEELARFQNVKHGAIFVNPGTRRPIDEDPNYVPNLQELLVKVAGYCEARNVPFYQMTGVEGHGFYPPKLMFAVEQAAPKMCRGFLFGECSVETNNHIDYLITLMDYVLPRQKKVLYFQQTSYWMGIMQHHEGEPGRFIKILQEPKYRDVFVPMWENLLPASQGLCFGSTMGFWRGGLTSDWGVSAQSWGYANLNLGGTADMPGHWWLRMFIHAVTTGGRFVEIEPIWPFDGENTEGQIRHSKQWAHTLRWIGDMRSQLLCDLEPDEELRALRYVDRLISAGIVRPPAKPEFLKSLPDVSLKVIDQDTPSKTRYRWGIFRRALEENWWTLGDCPNAWEMAIQTHTTDVLRTLYNSSHTYDQTFPETPYGIVSIVPPGSSLPPSTRVIECDGYSVLQGDTWLDLQAAHDFVVMAYEDAAERLSFRARGCFLSVVEAGPDSYLAYLIDPEERFPTGVETELEINLKGRFICTDAITLQDIPVPGSRIQVHIPPAGFRVFLLRRRPQ